MIPRNELERQLSLRQPGFDRIYGRKDATAVMLEMLFAPNEYPEFHAYLDVVHELWILDMNENP